MASSSKNKPPGLVPNTERVTRHNDKDRNALIVDVTTKINELREVKERVARSTTISKNIETKHNDLLKRNGNLRKDIELLHETINEQRRFTREVYKPFTNLNVSSKFDTEVTAAGKLLTQPNSKVKGGARSAIQKFVDQSKGDLDGLDAQDQILVQRLAPRQAAVEDQEGHINTGE